MLKVKEGFTVVGDGCEKAIMEGCMISIPNFPNYCMTCDSYSGYFQLENNGPCVKHPTQRNKGKLLKNLAGLKKSLTRII